MKVGAEFMLSCVFKNHTKKPMVIQNLKHLLKGLKTYALKETSHSEETPDLISRDYFIARPPKWFLFQTSASWEMSNASASQLKPQFSNFSAL